MGLQAFDRLWFVCPGVQLPFVASSLLIAERELIVRSWNSLATWEAGDDSE